MQNRPTFNIRLWVIAMMMWHAALAFGQNLVPNHSFETITACPFSHSGIGLGLAPPWTMPTNGTSDLFNSCAPVSTSVSVPLNFPGYQPPVTGNGYAGFYTKTAFVEYREYVQVRLDEPMFPGQGYYVSFYVSLGNNACAIQKIGAYFSEIEVSTADVLALDFVPQVEWNGGFLNDTAAWTLIEGYYVAEGTEEYMIIGCFQDDGNNPLDPTCTVADLSYYYLDDVTVIHDCDPQEIPVELGGPVTACYEYEIDPMEPGYVYLWEDGTQGGTLVVEESGTYTVTVTDGCDVGEDEIEVTIIPPQPPVNIPEASVALCDGLTYIVSLDPATGEYTWQDGSHETEYEITTTGTYTVTLDDGCVVSEDEIHVEFVPALEPFDLGDNPVLCFGSTIEYDFDPSLGEFLWQDGSTGSQYTIDGPGYYALTITNACNEQSASTLVTGVDVPEVELGPDQLLLCGGEAYPVVFNPALGEFLWQDGSTSSSYTITDPGLYTVFVSNQCGTSTDQMQVSVADSPVFNLGQDPVLCPGDQLTLDGDGVVGAYTWQDGSTSTTYPVTTPGTYSLTITTACGTGTDSVYVGFQDYVAQPNLGPDINICPGAEWLLEINDPNASFVWQDGSTGNSFLVTTAGTYHVQAYNGCGPKYDTIVVTMNAEPPALNLIDTLTLCQGQAITIESNVAGVTYEWSDMSTGASLTVSSPGVYGLTVTSHCGTSAGQVVVNDGGPAPLVDLGVDPSLCAGETLLLTPAFSNVDTWLWQDGSTDSTFEISAGEVATVLVTNACGTSYDTATSLLLPAIPSFSLGNDTAVCDGESVALTIGLADISIAWLDGSTAPDFIATNAGPYYATISNACGSYADTIYITALPAVPALTLGSDQSLCPGEIIVIDPGIPDVNYAWQDGSTSSSFSVTHADTVILAISNACGISTDTVFIVESTEGPDVNLGADISGCVGDEVVIQAGISGVDYEWQDGSALPSFTTAVSGEFILEVSNSCGTDVDTILVSLEGVVPTLVLGSDTTLCDSDSMVLSVTLVPGDQVTWQDGSTNPELIINTAGTFHATISNACGNASDTLVVSYLAAPAPFDLGNDTTLCPGESIVLQAPHTADALLWQDGSALPVLVADAAQVYALQISNACGTYIDELALAIDTNVPVLALAPTTPWCPGEIITVHAGQPFPAEYAWSTGETSSTLSISTPGTYSVTVDARCAGVSGTMEVTEGDDCFPKTTFFIPNLFSPNGDNVNDVFEVKFNAEADVMAMQGALFDRWGNTVFASRENPFAWNGTLDGEALNPGVYVYMITVVYRHEGVLREEVLTGDVTLVR